MNEPSPKTLAAVLAEFGVASEVPSVTPLGHGHIHDTYLVQGPEPPLVLQRINAGVFPHLEHVALNVGAVVQALEAAQRRDDYPLETARPLVTTEGQSLAHVKGETWRATPYLESTYTVQQVDTPQRAASAAEAFGRFCAALVSIDPQTLAETIPGFHDFDRRMEQLDAVVGKDAEGRCKRAGREIDYCREQAGLGPILRKAQDTLPLRVCHNDTKIDNLLFDETDHRPRAVIDLDTCMPGWWMHDFGDIVRTFCSPEPEDSVHHDRVGVREDIFEAVGAGFARPLEPHFAIGERESLWLGACAIPLIIGMRFLADHLAGDEYFGVSRENQNLDRARNQLALHRDLIARENRLRPLLGPG